MAACINCGKGEEASINLKSCAACMSVKYCSRDCQIAHRPQHKKECKKRAKELHDEKLFKQPPPLDDCPICMIRIPSLCSGSVYMNCCGKVVCRGCVFAVQSRAFLAGTPPGDEKCPFCRIPVPTSDEEYIKRLHKRSDMNDAESIHNLGVFYANGMRGFQQNRAKALELWHRAAKLGSASSCYNIGYGYKNGVGVERDVKKTKHYWELAATRGNLPARCHLGIMEGQAGNMKRALKHWMIGVKGGGSTSLVSIKRLYENGHAAKDVYDEALQYYQAYLDEIKTDQRDQAAAIDDDYKYY